MGKKADIKAIIIQCIILTLFSVTVKRFYKKINPDLHFFILSGKDVKKVVRGIKVSHAAY